MPAFSHALLRPALFVPCLFGGPVAVAEPLSIEVFTTTDLTISGNPDSRQQGAAVTVYFVDGLAQFESVLSEGLPVDADAAEAEALRRLGELNDAGIAPPKHTAMGLAKAIQLGVDRYPAIVFDGAAVAYGITDLAGAVGRYAVWREAQGR